jgi:hypothetical protein
MSVHVVSVSVAPGGRYGNPLDVALDSSHLGARPRSAPDGTVHLGGRVVRSGMRPLPHRDEHRGA